MPSFREPDSTETHSHNSNPNHHNMIIDSVLHLLAKQNRSLPILDRFLPTSIRRSSSLGISLTRVIQRLRRDAYLARVCGSRLRPHINKRLWKHDHILNHTQSHIHNNGARLRANLDRVDLNIRSQQLQRSNRSKLDLNPVR